jgi:hypothetical protein
MQAMQLHPAVSAQQLTASYNSAHIASATTEKHWIDILTTVLSPLLRVYLVIDAEILGLPGRNSEGLQGLLRVLQRIVEHQTRTTIKIALLTYRKRPFAQALNLLPELHQTMSIQMERRSKSVSSLRSFAPSTRSAHCGKGKRVFKGQILTLS